MKLKQLLKLNSKGIAHHVALIIVVLAVAIGGTFYLVATHADVLHQAIEIETVANHESSSQNPGLVLTQSVVRDIGSQTVARLAQNNSVNLSAYHGGGGWTDTSACYTIQSTAGTSRAVITDGAGSLTGTVPDM